MAYLHCHACGWSQDDFWSKDYSPLRNDVIGWLHELLLKDTISVDLGPGLGAQHVDTRAYVTTQLQKMADVIRTMRWRTEEEWRRDKDTAACPNCGSQDFDID